MPRNPEQFERLPAEQPGEEEEKLKPEKPAELELSPEQDKELLSLIKKARQAENQGDNEEAIILLQDIKERLSKIKEEREGRERRKPEITEEDWKAMEDGLEACREKGNWGLFFERAMYMKILDPEKDLKITKEDWKEWKAMEDELERLRKEGIMWVSFSILASNMKILASSKVEVPPGGGLKVE